MAGVEYKKHSEFLEPCSLAAVKLTPLLILMSSLQGQQEQFWGNGNRKSRGGQMLKLARFSKIFFYRI